MVTLKRYTDGWWLRIGRFTIGKDSPAWHFWCGLAEREGWERAWRWRGYRVTWKIQ